MQFEDILAQAYFRVLMAVVWDDPVVVSGLREGLNKFLSNAHLAIFRGRNKYHKTHWISPAALSQLSRGICRELVFEHVVPKTEYIQAPCEQRARDGTLTVEFIAGLLRQYWQLATVTKGEDATLVRVAMPLAWDRVNVRARYEAAGLVLVPNPYFETAETVTGGA